MTKFFYLLSGCFFTLILSGCTPTPTSAPVSSNVMATPTTALLTPTTNPLCDWVNTSEVIVKLKFADSLTAPDTSYEVGFVISPINRYARLARQACDYQTGFKLAELKDLGTVQVAVWGYTDNRRRQLANEPVTVVFDKNGTPDIGQPITVEVLD